MKFKKGDKVKVSDVIHYYDGKIYWNQSNAGKIGTIKIINEEGLSLPYSVEFEDGNSEPFIESDLTLVTPLIKTLDNLEVGDVVMHSSATRTVLAVLGSIVFLSDCQFEKRLAFIYSTEDLRVKEYKVKQPTITTALTRQQIADKFGISVDDLIIKGDE